MITDLVRNDLGRISQVGGDTVPARKPGDAKLHVLEDAPGSYAKLRLDQQSSGAVPAAPVSRSEVRITAPPATPEKREVQTPASAPPPEPAQVRIAAAPAPAPENARAQPAAKSDAPPMDKSPNRPRNKKPRKRAPQ